MGVEQFCHSGLNGAWSSTAKATNGPVNGPFAFSKQAALKAFTSLNIQPGFGTVVTDSLASKSAVEFGRTVPEVP